MRILQIIPSFGVGGAEQMVSHLMVGLSKSHDVTGLSFYGPSGGPIEPGLKRANIPLVHLGKHRGFDPRMFRALDRVVRDLRPDVVHTHLSVLRYVLPVLVRRPVPAAVHTLHNLAEYESDAIGRLIQWFAFRRWVLPIAISRECASSLQRVYGVECPSIVPNCIPVLKYRRSPVAREHWRRQEKFPPDAVVFTCVGRLEPQKDPLLLLRAFAALNDPRCHLVLLGDGSLRDRVKACIMTLGLERRVRVLGKREDVPEWLAASDVFVLASAWEGNPLAVMEAMAAGLPIVSTAVGGVPELIQPGRHGLLVPPANEESLARAMLYMLEHPERRIEMGRASSISAVAAFGIERMADGYIEVYRSAFHRPASRAATVAV